MSELKSIIKYELINRLSLNKIFRGSKKKKGSIIGIIVAIILGIFSLVTGYIYSIYTVFAEFGCETLILLVSMAFASFVCLITNIPMCESTIFHSRDYEMLLSMPIKTKHIITSKIFTLLIINYFTIVSIVLSSVLVLAIHSQIILIEVLLVMLALLVMPFFPLGLSLIISYLFTKLLSKVKHRNVIITILYLLFIAGVMVVTQFITNIDDVTNAYELIMNFSKKISYVTYLGYLGIMGDAISFIIYYLISIGVFVLLYHLLSKNFCMINSNLLTIHTKDTYDLDNNKTKLNILKLEFKKYGSLPGYVLNTICGPFMGSLMLIMLSFQGLDLSIIQIGSHNYSALLLMAVISMFISLSPVTASTVSLEGNKLWIYKSMPLDPKKIFTSKVGVSLCINTSFLLLDSIVMLCVWHLSLIDCLLIFSTTSLYSIFISYMGLYINLCFPKLDWVNPIKVVKNSLAVLITLITGFVLYVGLIIVALTLIAVGLNEYLIFAAIIGILALLVIIIIKITYTKGVTLWKNLH